MKKAVLYFLFILLIIVVGCSKKSEQVVELKQYPLDNLDGIITLSNVQFDKKITSDGNGSVRIIITEPTTIRLFEVGDIDIENARLTYQAKIKTEDMDGKVYLEMFCCFTGKGEFFSKDIQTPIIGTTNWVTEETPFFLQKGENPDNIKLNLVIEGKGTVWIDDIKLFKGPLR